MLTKDKGMLSSVSSSDLYYIITDTVRINVTRVNSAMGIALHESNTVPIIVVVVVVIIINLFSPISY
jgi:hypothetical protein